MQKVIVTGGAGFIGSHLVDHLVDKGFEVHIIDNLSGGKKENINDKAVFHKLDIRDLEGIKPVIKGAKFVFHLAALPRVQDSIDNPKLTSEVNIDGTLNILIASKEGGVKRVIYSASSSAYGDQDKMPLKEDMKVLPKSPYGMQKYIGEVLCSQWSLTYGLETVSLRYFNVYGDRISSEGSYPLVLSVFLEQKKKGEPLTITGDGNQTRDFTHVSDVVLANVLAASSDKVGKGEVLNIGFGEKNSINDLAHMISDNIKYIEARHEPLDSLADNSLAKKLLGWEPKIDLKTGVSMMLN